MTDLEITKLCAEAMGYRLHPLDDQDIGPTATTEDGRSITFNPLYEDRQAMALVKRFRLVIEPDYDWGVTWINSSRIPGKKSVTVRKAADLNRAICECVAQIQQQFAAKERE